MCSPVNATGQMASAVWPDSATRSMVAYAAHSYLHAYGIAEVFSELGDTDNTLLWLDRAVDQRTIWLAAVRSDPAFTALHGDARWPALLLQLKPQ